MNSLNVIRCPSRGEFITIPILNVSNNIEDEFYLHGIGGVNIYQIKLFLLLYADDITIVSEAADGLQSGLNVVFVRLLSKVETFCLYC